MYPFIFFFKCGPDVRDFVAGSRPLRKVPHSVGETLAVISGFAPLVSDRGYRVRVKKNVLESII